MNFIKYKIKEGDTLESIAEKETISIKELIDFHNSLSTITQSIITNYLPIHLEYLLIPIKDRTKQSSVDSIGFDMKAVYRCEQVNTTIIDNKTVSTSLQKTQFNVKLSIAKKLAKVNLDDYYYNLTPPFLNEVFEFIKNTEFIRNNVLLNYSDKGKVDKILNKKDQFVQWNNFKNSEHIDGNFIRTLRNNNKVAFDQLLEAGEVQFSEEHDSVNEYQATPFYSLFFDEYLTDENFSVGNIQNKNFRSSLFPTLDTTLELKTSKISESENDIWIRIVNSPELSEDLLSTIRNKYEESYQPSIHFSFTKYKIDYRSRINIDKKSNLIKEGILRVREAVVDNVESLFEFKIRRLEHE